MSKKAIKSAALLAHKYGLAPTPSAAAVSNSYPANQTKPAPLQAPPFVRFLQAAPDLIDLLPPPLPYTPTARNNVSGLRKTARKLALRSISELSELEAPELLNTALCAQNLPPIPEPGTFGRDYWALDYSFNRYETLKAFIAALRAHHNAHYQMMRTVRNAKDSPHVERALILERKKATVVAESERLTERLAHATAARDSLSVLELLEKLLPDCARRARLLGLDPAMLGLV
ncbi:hypothetical protein [Roseateles albus]|uniref:Uncharacterized protein n=1 Tax=Roseateles albus TaxID=2987525 RepID=A0ABT5KCV9_9BURK|nr:hypothetical protein [Roseateles albus]MDC8771753.1 hypothetical protein [Roseateles albus]